MQVGTEVVIKAQSQGGSISTSGTGWAYSPGACLEVSTSTWSGPGVCQARTHGKGSLSKEEAYGQLTLAQIHSKLHLTGCLSLLSPTRDIFSPSSPEQPLAPQLVPKTTSRICPW